MLASCGGADEPDVFRVTDASVAYDVDNDGFADVGIYQRPDGGPGEYRVYFGGPNGLDAGRFAAVPAGQTFGNAFWVGDIDNDGFADAAITEQLVGASPSITLIYGGGDRTLTQTSARCDGGVAPDDESGARVTWVGDVTGDGVDDLIATAGGQRFCIWAGGQRINGDDPTFFFQPPVGTGPAPGAARFIRGVGDATGDGINDVWAGIELVVGGPDPLNAPRGELPIGPSLGASDYDGDGYVDLLAGGSSGRDLLQTVAYGRAAGFGEPVEFKIDPSTTTVTTESEWADLGDVDGDGKGDGAFAVPFRNQAGLDLSTEGWLVMLYGRGDGLTGRASKAGDTHRPKHAFLPKSSSAGLNGFRPGFVMGLGDINGDGFGDVGVENQSGGLVWYFGSASGVPGSQADGYVIFNRSAPRMAVTGAGRR